MKTIAVIDDDPHIGDALEELLRREGYAVARAYSGTEALLLLEKTRPDLALLDLMLPGLPGEEVLSRMRGVPVIVLSARVDVSDKVRLLLGGAADYMTKPFDPRELLARIAVQLRASAARGEGAMTCGGVTLDAQAREAHVGEQTARLTRTECALLRLLMTNADRPLSKSAILERISLDTPDCTEASLKIHVSNLRKKLRDAGAGEVIEAVWGIGFRFNANSRQKR